MIMIEYNDILDALHTAALESKERLAMMHLGEVSPALIEELWRTRAEVHITDCAQIHEGDFEDARRVMSNIFICDTVDGALRQAQNEHGQRYIDALEVLHSVLDGGAK